MRNGPYEADLFNKCTNTSDQWKVSTIFLKIGTYINIGTQSNVFNCLKLSLVITSPVVIPGLNGVSSGFKFQNKCKIETCQVFVSKMDLGKLFL